MRVAMFSAAFRFLLALAAALAQTASAEPALGVVPAAPWPGPSWDLSHGPLKVSSDGHYLVCSDGTPFIWIGDTAWDLFHKLTLDETERYLENRRAKGFTVVQCVLFAMNLGPADKAACGAPIFVDSDPTKPNEAFFKNVDGVVEAARKKGIYLLIFPTWGRHICLHKYITAANAYSYARFLGQRYKNAKNVIWSLGGDERPNSCGWDQLPIWRDMARGLKDGDGGLHLITYHPVGPSSSAQWLHGEPWLGFNMYQSGHGTDRDQTYKFAHEGFNLKPPKPIVNGECGYEAHPLGRGNKDLGNEYDVRKATYWSIFGGSCGHTYGHLSTCQLYKPGWPNWGDELKPLVWDKTLDAPGAVCMSHVRNLLASRPFITMQPDQSLIVSGQAGGGDHVEAARGDGFIFVYIPSGKPVEIRLGVLSGQQLKAWWFNPRDGKAVGVGSFPNSGIRRFQPPAEPSARNDWILVLDDTVKKFVAPGFVKGKALVSALAAAPSFPLKASPDGRYLVDARNRPFFYQADTPWMLFRLGPEEVDEYLNDRRARGFTALQIMLTGFMDMRTRDGLTPFGRDNNLGHPNESYFARADAIIKKATDKGFVLAIAPLWSGCCGEGWTGQFNGKWKPLNVNGPSKAREFGRWLGARYAAFPNLIWIMGGDHNPDQSFEVICELAAGIHEMAPHQLMTVHNAPDNSSAAFYDEMPWLGLDAAYSYRELQGPVYREWSRPKNVRPILLLESGYEHEANDGRQGTPFRVRRQVYAAVLNGALVGTAYGHRDIWRFSDQWRTALADPGATQVGLAQRFFSGRPWWKLEPDQGDGLVAEGRGKVDADDYVSAARAADGTLVIAYLPTARPVTVDMARLAGRVKAVWYDPTDGSDRVIDGTPLANHGIRQFTPPGRNAAGESDWVLVLEGAKR